MWVLIGYMLLSLFGPPPAFSPLVNNPYFPLSPGARFVYQSEDERIVTEVLWKTKTIEGACCIVVHDRAYVGDSLIEDTYDWYTQAADGTVWYYGEDTKTIKNGKVTSTTGSWMAGVDGAQPGPIMLAKPTVGAAYQQEYLRGVAEDEAEVIRLNETITVGGVTYAGCIRTKEWTRLESGVVEEKLYAPGVGCIWDDGAELVRVKR